MEPIGGSGRHHYLEYSGGEDIFQGRGGPGGGGTAERGGASAERGGASAERGGASVRVVPQEASSPGVVGQGGGSISATVPASSSASEVLLLLRRAVAENTGVQFRRIAMSLRGKVVQHEVDLPPPHSLTAAEAASLLGGGERRVVVLEGEGGGLG